MGFLRNRGVAEGATTYQMREEMFSIGDDYWIETGVGERAIRVDGKALRARDTLVLKDPSGHELFRIQEKKLRVRDTMKIERGDQTVATIKKALVGLRERFSITVEGGDDIDIKGNVADHEYKFKRGGDNVAEVSKRWVSLRDTYGVEVAPGEDDALILAATVCIERMAHD